MPHSVYQMKTTVYTIRICDFVKNNVQDFCNNISSNHALKAMKNSTSWFLHVTYCH